jgi:hypothetical protein
MEKLPEIKRTADCSRIPAGVRVLAQALQMFDDRPPRNRMEHAVCRKLADQMQQLVRHPASVAQVFQLSTEFPVIEALVDDFLLSSRIARSRDRDCPILEQLMRRLTNA